MGSGFDDWIYWHFFTITVNYDSSQSMTVYDSLSSLLNYQCLPFCVTDLVLICESAISSASVVRWLTRHSWTLELSNCLLKSLTNEQICIHEWTLCYHFERTEQWPPHRTLHVLFTGIRCNGNAWWSQESISVETLFVDHSYPRIPWLNLRWHENAF
jgi:hypothetical protein